MLGAQPTCDPLDATAAPEVLRRYHRRIEALVRKYAPWRCATACVDLDDYRSVAWEAAFRVRQRYRDLGAMDLENVTFAAVRNALINLRRYPHGEPPQTNAGAQCARCAEWRPVHLEVARWRELSAWSDGRSRVG